MSDYESFLASKRHMGGQHGFEPDDLPDFLYPFQRDLVAWQMRKGRGAIFADCGLGKTPMQLVWADAVAKHAGKPVLIGTPLAVSYQVADEGDKFGIEVHRSQDGTVPKGARVVVTNYERVSAFRPDDFAGMVADESSILKNFNGTRKAEVTEFMRTLPYRMLCTATAAPNDYTELGTSSEALGELPRKHMLSRFFTHDSGDTGKWRLKGHVRSRLFWRWVCSWARACRRPSDLGYDDGAFVLPPLIENQHVVRVGNTSTGYLFQMPARGLNEQRAHLRATIRERCEKVAELVDHDRQAFAWCQLNDEGDALTSMIDGAEQVKGSDSDADKEARLLAFQRGDLRCLVTKPKIGAWGLNLQGCAHTTLFPSHSYEQYYQAIRRFWRFGQKNPVRVDIVTTEGEADVSANMARKSDQADAMFRELVKHMNEATEQKRATVVSGGAMEAPSWL